MGFLSDKPYTAVTATIERLTSPSYPKDDFGEIVDLIEVTTIQTTGYVISISILCFFKSFEL